MSKIAQSIDADLRQDAAAIHEDTSGTLPAARLAIQGEHGDPVAPATEASVVSYDPATDDAPQWHPLSELIKAQPAGALTTATRSSLSGNVAFTAPSYLDWTDIVEGTFAGGYGRMTFSASIPMSLNSPTNTDRTVSVRMLIDGYAVNATSTSGNFTSDSTAGNTKTHTWSAATYSLPLLPTHRVRIQVARSSGEVGGTIYVAGGSITGTAVGFEAITLAGDVTGLSDTNTVVKLQNRSVLSTAPTSGQPLTYNGTAWAPASLGGDVTGGIAANTVVKLQNRTVASTAPTDGQVLTWSAGSTQWQPATYGSPGFYGAYQDTTDQALVSTTAAQVITLNTVDGQNGFTLLTSSQVTATYAGTYNIMWSGQFKNISAADEDATIWLRKNGTDVTGSAGYVNIPQKHGSTPGHVIAAWNYVIALAAGDYIEFAWSASSTDVSLTTYPSGVSPTRPSTASVIVTVQVIAGAIKGDKGDTGDTGVVAATAPATYNSGTKTIGVTLGTGATDAAAGNHTHSPTVGLDFIIDGGGSVITPGIKGDVRIPVAMTITGVRLYADATGSAVVDIWKDTYANFPATVADSITASAKPTLSTANKYEDTTLTGWTKSLSAGDVLRFNVDSASTITRLTVSLSMTRTV